MATYIKSLVVLHGYSAKYKDVSFREKIPQFSISLDGIYLHTLGEHIYVIHSTSVHFLYLFSSAS